jgi:hypothetical protein
LPSSKKVVPEDCLRRNASTSVDAVKVAHHEESAVADDEMVGYAPKTNSEPASAGDTLPRGRQPERSESRASNQRYFPSFAPHVRPLLARVVFFVAPLVEEPRVKNKLRAG